MEKSKNNTCSNCGGVVAPGGYTHTERVGRYTVTDGSGVAVPKCTSCGDVELTLDQLAGYQRRAAATTLRRASEVDGAVVRYARKALGKRQVDLAQELGCSSETVSRYETGELPVPRPVQLALVALLDGAEMGTSSDGGDRPSTTLHVPECRRAVG